MEAFLPIIEELGGGIGAIGLVCLGYLYWQSQKQVNELQEKRIQREREHGAELRDTSQAVMAAIQAIKSMHQGGS